MIGRLAHAEVADEGQRTYGVDYAQRDVTGFGVGHRAGEGIREDGKTIIRDRVAPCMSLRIGARRGRPGAMFVRIGARSRRTSPSDI
ncbi:TPA: hypothetical protein SAY52_000921 [Burkholderia cenocepacia]|uniref:hypothetical protein n=1 Tax=unclassified Burkholderia TaxID=2613784 RepID=UPI001589C4C2|nr:MULTISPECIES: hypothetical protein [unclassified Burkholderia]HEF5870355.1 hypothetical protein [Burkholderia cenocepacia]